MLDIDLLAYRIHFFRYVTKFRPLGLCRGRVSPVLSSASQSLVLLVCLLNPRPPRGEFSHPYSHEGQIVNFHKAYHYT